MIKDGNNSFTPTGPQIHWKKFDSKAGTTAKAIETLMGQYFDQQN